MKTKSQTDRKTEIDSDKMPGKQTGRQLDIIDRGKERVAELEICPVTLYYALSTLYLRHRRIIISVCTRST